MVHGRVVRPPSAGAPWTSVDASAVLALARRPQGRARRPLPRRRRPRANTRRCWRRGRCRRRRVERNACAAQAWRSVRGGPRRAVGRRYAGRSGGAARHGRRNREGACRRPIGGRSRCMARSVHRARWRKCVDGNCTVWTHSAGRLSRCALHWPSCSACRWPRCVASTSKDPAATVTTAPTTSPPMPCCLRAPGRVHRCGCSGCAKTSMASSRSGRP